ncbi:MAG: cell division protein FtsW [Deltaproteobacteria bacterium RIFCSPLOWO2_01_44_7]|nr:MAG: cell division protein FtsW [Deltaproteobacteria bacterium RIFCSPHIGHO2_01_FULL_43_49]OGQ14310.1 MAG: cell division protein FtsW [Deltaproteobacteria bacterium RIFCSPHIGHO2_02_FULL_44_53]OGQ27650.1 MAG: cell division protein FtsW [Deltaproteobacteria bacterium RIFCSPHIGHO2_12_FULL_44_21]OGQ30751.1 MAG: cell division protein FtsW [Deltaproteobacteria bacterium RIFCSPLOWO2_01_FULL_45_74]OGQ41136.1 MAG: cell division protein FtsW [Deltaproteobacteria bacterium RIFCSPLOWO2_01_44_7]OGQ42431.
MKNWDENTVRHTRFDYPLLIIVVLLSGLGLTMVFSSSAVLAQERFGDGLFFLKKMLTYACLGFAVMSLIMRVPYLYWKKLVYPLFIISFIFMLLTLYSGLGLTVSGARRWIILGPFHFQTSELAKIVIILFLAYSLERKSEKMERFAVGVAPNILIPGILVLMVLFSKDLGTAFVMGLLIVTMLFLGGTSFKHLFFLFLGAVPMFFYLIFQEGYRVRRITGFLNPWADRYGAGFQMIQSLLAFSEGGILGKGLGAGQQKLFYLPEAHTDFIFSVLGEELGLIGVIMTIVFFLLFCHRGIKIATQAPDLFGRYLGLGIVILIGLQSLLNMAVVMGLLPTKGLVLPFISYGGSALVMTLFSVGILLNISMYQAAGTPPMFKKR